MFYYKPVYLCYTILYIHAYDIKKKAFALRHVAFYCYLKRYPPKNRKNIRFMYYVCMTLKHEEEITWTTGASTQYLLYAFKC